MTKTQRTFGWTSQWTRGRALLAGVAAGGVVLLAACSGSGADGGTIGAGGGASDESAPLSRGSAVQDFRTSGEAPKRVTPVVLADRKLVKRAAIGLESPHVDRVLGELDGVVTVHGGLVESQDVRTDDDGDATYATMVLRVPVDRFETAVEDITGLAKLVREQTSTENVTDRVADVDARVDSAERSIAQLQRLFSQATEMGDVIALESELSQRQAELESLQARQRALERQTALSTIHLTVTEPDPSRDPRDDPPPGFVNGLSTGWSGLVAFVRGATHVVGLLLPFSLLAAVLALPAWLIIVRRSRLLTPEQPAQERTGG